MIRNNLTKTVFVLGLGTLAIIVVWVALFFLIQKDKAVVVEVQGRSSQLLGVSRPVTNLNKEKVAKINDYFIAGGSTIKLLETIESLGQKAGVKLAMGQAGENVTELKLNLSTEGSYSSTLKFLQSLETLPYAAKVDRLELRKGEKLWQSVFILRILKNSNV